MTIKETIYYFCQAEDRSREREREVVVRDFMANIGAMTKEGHEHFMKFVKSFDRQKSWSERKSELSPGMLKFLGKAGEDG